MGVCVATVKERVLTLDWNRAYEWSRKYIAVLHRYVKPALNLKISTFFLRAQVHWFTFFKFTSFLVQNSQRK